MKVLLASTYELGHQPLHVAGAAAALRAGGHEVMARDLSLDPLDRSMVDWADAVAFSVPMHTAMRLATEAARGVRDVRPGVPIAFYGLYATVESDPALVDVAIAGEYEGVLCRWVDALAEGVDFDGPALIELGRSHPPAPFRKDLPGLDRYAHLAVDGEHRKVGYVEASRGCRHRCRHCPVPTVYDGRLRIAAPDRILDDVGRLVEMGAGHLTFGDPDFLNAPRHSLRVVRSLHERFPRLTFDVTTKVENILRHRGLWEELAGAGLLFVVSAFETTNDLVLDLLDKGHTVADESAAVGLLRDRGVEIRPTWLPFTPWTRLEDLADIARFLIEHDLLGNVDPVQLTIRLLIPDGSLLLDLPEITPYLEGYDRQALSWRWHAADPRVDQLHHRLSSLVAESVAAGDEPVEVMVRLIEVILDGRSTAPAVAAGIAARRPRLTEPWFC